MSHYELNRPRAILIAIIAISVLLGGIYVFCVPPGLPYDEPAHFGTVRYYASHFDLPVLGSAGTNYEAYQAPLYYFMMAPVDRLVRPLGARTEFYLLRIVGLLLLIPLGLFAYRVATRVFGSDSVLALLTTAFVCLNPALLGMAASIQNDMLSVVLSFWIIDAVGRYIQDSSLTTRSAILLGALISAAMLAKMSVVFFPIPIAWFVWSRHGRASLRYMAIVVGVIALGTGWWFVRNKVLYGEFTAVNTMLKLVGQSAPHIELWKPSVLIPYLRNFVAYGWLPVDYFRSLIKSSLWERAVVMIFTVLAAVGWWLAGKDSRNLPPKGARDFRKFLFVAYGVCFVIYFYAYNVANPYPPRVLYPMFLAYAVFYSFGLCRVFRRLSAADGRAAVCAFSVVLILLSITTCREAQGYRTIDFLPEVNHYLVERQTVRRA